MSAQGATIRRGPIHLPIWPVAGLVAIAAAVVVMSSVFDGVERRGEDAAPSTETAAVNNPGMWTLAQAETYLNQLQSLEVRNPGMWTLSQAQSYLDSIEAATYPTGLENPGYAPAWDSIGGPNEALHRHYSPPQNSVALTPGSDPITVNGKACMQCR
jgi:hypothetical protein